MLRIRELKISLDGGQSEILAAAAKRLKIKPDDILSFRVSKKSVDARKKSEVHFNITIDTNINNEAKVLAKLKNEPTVSKTEEYHYDIPSISTPRKRPVIIGSGPAGLFAAWTLAKAGAMPIVIERGQDVDSRTAKVEKFWQSGELDPECNAQFGEGGAGTFSDGKLTTGMKDRRIELVLRQFVACGAPEEILYAGKPHIGTDKLRGTIKTLRNEIISLGGEVIFGARFCDFERSSGAICSVSYERNGSVTKLETDNVILAVGHSARDVFQLLYEKGVELIQKPFSAGMRIEHRQSWLNRAMYGDFAEHSALGAADYKLAVHLPNGRGVYTFCMCPGGHVVAAASELGGVVTNGMSYHARNSENSNAAVLVSVEPADFGSNHPLAGIEFQRRLERAAFSAGGGNYTAPAVCFGELLSGKASGFGDVVPSYRPGVVPVHPAEYLPEFIVSSLKDGISQFGRKIKGFDAPEAVLTGVESRSSSPVRILRTEQLCSTNIRGLYPCGEGAGYAGGIMSAAVDGIKCAEAVIENLK